MATQYSLTVINKSSSTGSFLIFQKPPAGIANVLSLALFARPVDPGAQATFQWTPDDQPETHGSDTRTVSAPQPSYWVAFGAFTPGQVLDVGGITNAVEVTFPEPTTAHTVTLGPDDVLSVTA